MSRLVRWSGDRSFLMFVFCSESKRRWWWRLFIHASQRIIDFSSSCSLIRKPRVSSWNNKEMTNSWRAFVTPVKSTAEKKSFIHFSTPAIFSSLTTHANLPRSSDVFLEESLIRLLRWTNLWLTEQLIVSHHKIHRSRKRFRWPEISAWSSWDLSATEHARIIHSCNQLLPRKTVDVTRVNRTGPLSVSDTFKNTRWVSRGKTDLKICSHLP